MEYIPRRVVSLQPSATVILRDLGRMSSLTACTKYCAEVCPEIAKPNLAIVADSWTAQSEQILKIQPDLVIAAVPIKKKLWLKFSNPELVFWGWLQNRWSIFTATSPPSLESWTREPRAHE